MNVPDRLADAWSARAGLPHGFDDNIAALASNVGEWTAGMIRIASDVEPQYIKDSLAGFRPRR